MNWSKRLKLPAAVPMVSVNRVKRRDCDMPSVRPDGTGGFSRRGKVLELIRCWAQIHLDPVVQPATLRKPQPHSSTFCNPRATTAASTPITMATESKQ
jgi:hypothetical protein